MIFTIIQDLKNSVEKFENKIAIVDGENELSFKSLNLFSILIAKKIKEIAKAANFPVFENIIPGSASIPSASAATLPVIKWKPNSPVAEAYLALAGELLPILSSKKSAFSCASL